MDNKLYRLRGVPDSPISVYGNMHGWRFSHMHPEVELMLVRGGTLHLCVDDREVTLREGDIFIISPNQLHTGIAASADGVYMDITFSLEAITMPAAHIFQRNFVSPLSDGRLLLPSLLQSEHPAYPEVRSIMEQLLLGNPYNDDTKMLRFTRIVAICAALLPYCTISRAKEPRHSSDDLTVRKIMAFIHFHYSEPLTLDQLAGYVHLHPNYLCKYFKNYTSITIMEFLSRTRVEAAKFLLRRDSLSMTQVAEHTGFPSERAFYRQFRNITGMTPKNYQKKQIIAEAEYL